MAETFVLSFVEKLTALEKRAGSDVQHRIMPPISMPIYDRNSARKVARNIANFIGLSRFSFDIAFAKQEKNVGGHIDLSTNEVVFIEINPDAIPFSGSVEVTLCHEICHKWLQVRGISSPIEMDNEILTDITTVFLGFGKIMLNGCEVKKVSKDCVAGGTQTTTETRTTGYLKRDQLTFVYRLVCAMRNIPRSEYMFGLNSDATKAIQACDNSFSYCYNQRFHLPKTITETFLEIKTEGRARQRELSELNKHLEYVKQSFCETVERLIKTSYLTVEKLHQKSEAIVQESHHDPALSFLLAIKKDHELGKMTIKLTDIENNIRDIIRHSKVIGGHLWKNGSWFPTPSAAMFNIVICPNDGTKLRLPMDTLNLVVDCPNCHYRFAYDTTCVSYEAPASIQKQKPHWMRRIRNFFGGISRLLMSECSSVNPHSPTCE